MFVRPRSKRVRPHGLRVLATALLSACASEPAPPPPLPAAAKPAPVAALPGHAPTASELRDRSFVLREIVGLPELAGAQATITFRDGDLTFSAGCNAHFGPYQLAGGALRAQGFGATERGCPGPSTEHERMFAELLTRAPRMALDGSTLWLAEGAARLTFLDRVQADPDRPLVDTPWDLSSYSGHGSSRACFPDTAPALRFTSAGTYTVTSPCLDVAGRFEAGARALTLSATRTKQRRCADECGGMIAEFVSHVLTSGRLAYEIDAGSLTLRRSGYRIDAFDAR